MRGASWGRGARRATALALLTGALLFGSIAVSFSSDIPIATVPVGNSPAAIACDPISHLVFVGNYFGDSVSVIDGVSDTVTKTVSMPTTFAIGAVPLAIVTDPTRGLAYVANWQSHNVAFIAQPSLTVTTAVPLPDASRGGNPRALALDPSSTPPKLYVANYGKNNVSVLNAETGAYITTIAAGSSPRALGIFSSVTRTRIYVGNRYSNDVTIIDGASDTVTATVTLDGPPKAIAVHPSTGVAYVTVPSTDKVVVIGTGDSITTSIPVGDNPVGLGVLSSRDRLLVANYASDDLTAISTTSNAVVGTVTAGPGPFNVAVDQSDEKWFVTHYDGSTISSVDRDLNHTTVTVGQRPYATAVDEALVPHEAYVSNYTSDTVTVVDEPLAPQASLRLGVQEAHATEPNQRLSITIDPLPGDATSSVTPGITGSVAGQTSPYELAIVGVWYRLDAEVDWTRAEITSGAGSANVQWRAQVPSLTPGAHTVFVMAMDQGMAAAYSSSAEGAQGGGSSEDPVSYGFFVTSDDDTPPTTTIWDVPVGWSSADVTFTLTATDTVSGVAGTYYELNGGAPQVYSLPVGVTAEGTTTVAYWSVDASGNVEPTKTADVRIDKTPPATIDDAAATYAGSASVSMVASDALSGVVGTRYRLDGGAWTTGTVAVTAVVGTHDLEYLSVDIAGNIEATRSASFEVLEVPAGSSGADVPAGTGVEVTVGGVTLRFDEVTAGGAVIVTPLDAPTPALPGYHFSGANRDVQVYCAFAGEVDVRVPYSGVPESAERGVLLWHWDGTRWLDVTVTRDVAANTVTGRTASFSPFAVGYSVWEPTSTSNAGSLPTPHKGYTMSTNKCAVCHSVHSALTTGTVLLPTPALDACTYCHIDTAIGIRRIYGGLSSAYTYDATVTPFGGGFAHDTSGVACVECHSVHGAMTLNGGNTTKILKDWTQWRSASGAMDDYSTFALAKWPAPVSVADKYGQQTAWCTGCHKYFVESYETTVQVTDAGSWMFVKSHVMTAAAGAYANPVASTVATVAWAPSAVCRNCHDAGAVDTTGGVVPSSFPHYTPDNYRFMGVGESVAASGSDNTTGTVDGLCLKCHRDGSGQGAGLSF